MGVCGLGGSSKISKTAACASASGTLHVACETCCSGWVSDSPAGPGRTAETNGWEELSLFCGAGI